MRNLAERLPSFAEPMTKTERAELARVVRMNERVAKSAAAQRAAELLADFEAQVATDYHLNDEVIWQEAYAAANAAIDEANAKVAARCRELGIRDEFAPHIFEAYWSFRGEHASKARVQELRKVAQSRVKALEQAAKVEIEKRSAEIQTELVAGGLGSREAREFLASLPTVEALMPKLAVAEIEALTTPGALPDRSG